MLLLRGPQYASDLPQSRNMCLWLPLFAAGDNRATKAEKLDRIMKAWELYTQDRTYFLAACHRLLQPRPFITWATKMTLFRGESSSLFDFVEFVTNVLVSSPDQEDDDPVAAPTIATAAPHICLSSFARVHPTTEHNGSTRMSTRELVALPLAGKSAHLFK